ncbi:integrase [Deinococcus aestuarii]|uniref:tyrosine-type recombinase/integrase n=1 Tax=Deinococcus aestuarii TaxID=2774531 RepID=UPI0031B89227
MTASPLPRLWRTLERGDHEAFLDLIAGGLPGHFGSATRKNHLSSLRAYLRWTEEERRSVLNATPRDAHAYLGLLVQKHTHAPATIHNHLTRVRGLYGLLIEHGAHPGPNPFVGLKLPSNRPEEHRELYSEDEVRRLVTHASVRDRALVLLGAQAGLTGPEVLHLTWADVDTRAGQLSVLGRTVEAHGELLTALEVYGRERGHTELFAATGPVFDLSSEYELRKVVYLLCRRANVPYKAWRALRNAAGLRLLQRTGDPRAVAAQLGLGTLKAVEVWQKL